MQRLTRYCSRAPSWLLSRARFCHLCLGAASSGYAGECVRGSDLGVVVPACGSATGKRHRCSAWLGRSPGGLGGPSARSRYGFLARARLSSRGRASSGSCDRRPPRRTRCASAGIFARFTPRRRGTNCAGNPSGAVPPSLSGAGLEYANAIRVPRAGIARIDGETRPRRRPRVQRRNKSSGRSRGRTRPRAHHCQSARRASGSRICRGSLSNLLPRWAV